LPSAASRHGHMVFLPILQREFQRATRRHKTYWVRMSAAVVAACFGMVVVSRANSWTTSATVGRSLFELVSTSSFWACLFAGVFTTSVCLSEEKRQGTLGLLFLTPLKGHDVVIGKLANVSLNTFQTLMGVFPMMALSMVLGGLSLGEFWRMTLVLMNTLLFSLACGMFASAMSVRPARALAGTVALLALWTAPSALIDEFLLPMPLPASTDYILPGPFQAFALVWDGRYLLPPNDFWPSVAFTASLSFGQLALASCVLPRVVQEKIWPSVIHSWLGWRRKLTTADLAQLWQARRPMLRHNPVFWLYVTHRSSWSYLWVLLVVVILGWLVALACVGFTGRRIAWTVAMSLTPAIHAVLKIAVGSAAASRLNEARRNGELEFLLVTPLRAGRICRGHILALQRQFALPFALALIIDAGLLFFGGHLIAETPEQGLLRCLCLWAMMVMLLVDAHALAWLGLWQGLRCNNVFVAIRRTLLRILVLPWLVFLTTMCLGALGGPLGPLIWWGMIGFGFDHYYYFRSTRNLRDLFRTMASEWFTLHQSGTSHRRWRPRLLAYDLALHPQPYSGVP
jgi:hypothetical protein